MGWKGNTYKSYYLRFIFNCYIWGFSGFLRKYARLLMNSDLFFLLNFRICRILMFFKFRSLIFVIFLKLLNPYSFQIQNMYNVQIVHICWLCWITMFFEFRIFYIFIFFNLLNKVDISDYKNVNSVNFRRLPKNNERIYDQKILDKTMVPGLNLRLWPRGSDKARFTVIWVITQKKKWDALKRP